MPIVLAVFLGLVQGLAEFLPVSSSGHLILFQHIFDMPGDMMFFNIMLHIATLLAVLIVFKKRVWQLVRHPIKNLKMNLSLFIATIVTVGFVLLFNDFVEETFTVRVLPITFMITAIVLMFASTSNRPVGYQTAALTGFAQGLAVIPGFSRSGFTITTSRNPEFAFLMSIPIIIAALVWEVSRNSVDISAIGWLPMSIAFLTALLSGIFAIKFMLDIVRRIKLHWFSLYLILIAFVTLLVL